MEANTCIICGFEETYKNYLDEEGVCCKCRQDGWYIEEKEVEAVEFELEDSYNYPTVDDYDKDEI